MTVKQTNIHLLEVNQCLRDEVANLKRELKTEQVKRFALEGSKKVSNASTRKEGAKRWQ